MRDALRGNEASHRNINANGGVSWGCIRLLKRSRSRNRWALPGYRQWAFHLIKERRPSIEQTGPSDATKNSTKNYINSGSKGRAFEIRQDACRSRVELRVRSSISASIRQIWSSLAPQRKWSLSSTMNIMLWPWNPAIVWPFGFVLESWFDIRPILSLGSRFISAVWSL